VDGRIWRVRCSNSHGRSGIVSQSAADLERAYVMFSRKVATAMFKNGVVNVKMSDLDGITNWSRCFQTPIRLPSDCGWVLHCDGGGQ